MKKLAAIILCGIFLTGCGLFTSTTKNVNVKVSSFSADENYLSVTVTNEGSDASSNNTVYLVLDEIYTSNPDYTLATILSLAGGTYTSFQLPNQLTSSDGKGGHYASIYLDNQTSASKSAYYYDGSYSACYNNIKSKQSTWIYDIRGDVQNDFGWGATGSYSLQQLDRVTDESGSRVLGRRVTRTIMGTSTSLIQLDLEYVYDGYSSYIYDGVTARYTCSEEVVKHEYVHAFHREHVVQYSSWNDNIPDWFKEGLSVYEAGQGLKRVRYYSYSLKNSGYSSTEALTEMLEGVMDWKSGHTHDSNDYAGDFIAISFIRSFGSSALNNVINYNACGYTLDAAVIKYLPGVSSWSNFKSQLQTYADDYFADNVVWSKVGASSGTAVQNKCTMKDLNLQPTD